MLDTNITDNVQSMLAKASYITIPNFSWKYEDAFAHFMHSHNDSSIKPASKEDWESTVRDVVKLVPKEDSKRIKVQIYNHVDVATNYGAFGGGQNSGFVFSLDRKILGFHSWFYLLS